MVESPIGFAGDLLPWPHILYSNELVVPSAAQGALVTPPFGVGVALLNHSGWRKPLLGMYGPPGLLLVANKVSDYLALSDSALCDREQPGHDVRPPAFAKQVRLVAAYQQGWV